MSPTLAFYAPIQECANALSRREILKKEKCADPLAELINKKVVDIDMKPIFKIFTDLYDCAQSQSKAYISRLCKSRITHESHI